MTGSFESASATRGYHFKEIMHGRPVAYGIAFGVLAVVAAALVLDNAAVFLGAPVVVAIVVAIAFSRASSLAATDFFTTFAAAHGFSYSPRYDIVAYTPLLGAGDRRHADHYMEGPLGGGDNHQCALSQYTFEIRKEDYDPDGPDDVRWVPVDFTVCVVDLGSSAPPLGGVYLAKHLGLLDKYEEQNWLRRYRFPKTELESSDFHERYDLFVEPGQDEIALRQLFSPSLIEWFATHPLEPSFEYQAGVLVVYVEDQLDDAGHLQWLLDATRELAKRFEAFGGAAAAAA